MKTAFVAVLALSLCGTVAASRSFVRSELCSVERYAAPVEYLSRSALRELCIWSAAHGGMRGLWMEQSDPVVRRLGPDQLVVAWHTIVGSPWRVMLEERSCPHSTLSLIYFQPADVHHTVHMIVASYQSGQLNLVRLDTDEQHLSKWMRGVEKQWGEWPDEGHMHERHTD